MNGDLSASAWRNHSDFSRVFSRGTHHDEDERIVDGDVTRGLGSGHPRKVGARGAAGKLLAGCYVPEPGRLRMGHWPTAVTGERGR